MASSSLVGTRLGKYELQAEIGRGGMGAVYKAYDSALDRSVAVKVLAPHLVWEPEFVERFLREARAAARLKHPNIVTIYDVGQEGSWYYFVMEYLEGQSLTTLLANRPPMATQDALEILRPLADALDYAHGQGLVHRDVKPANVIIGPGGRVTLTDFGIAHATQATRLTRTGSVMGTPEYMSPEQALGRAVDKCTDQYSLAVVAYEMLAGKAPFQADSTPALLHKLVYDPPPPLREKRPDLPAGLEPVLARALAKDPKQRYGNCCELLSALEPALVPLSQEQKELATAVRPRQPRGGLKGIPAWSWGVGAAVVVALAIVVGIALLPGTRSEAPVAVPTTQGPSKSPPAPTGTAEPADAARAAETPEPTYPPEPTATAPRASTPDSAGAAQPTQPAYREPQALLELSASGSTVTDNFVLPRCAKAVFHFSASPGSDGRARLWLNLHRTDSDAKYSLLYHSALETHVPLEGAVLVPLAGGECYFSSETTDGDWVVRIECQDDQAPGGAGVDVEGTGMTVTGDFTLPRCNKSVFSWQAEPDEIGWATLSVRLCAVADPPQCQLIISALESSKDAVSGTAVQAVTEGVFFLVTSGDSPGWRVSWECND